MTSSRAPVGQEPEEGIGYIVSKTRPSGGQGDVKGTHARDGHALRRARRGGPRGHRSGGGTLFGGRGGWHLSFREYRRVLHLTGEERKRFAEEVTRIVAGRVSLV